jgi:hypothetical protein
MIYLHTCDCGTVYVLRRRPEKNAASGVSIEFAHEPGVLYGNDHVSFICDRCKRGISWDGLKLIWTRGWAEWKTK